MKKICTKARNKSRGNTLSQEYEGKGRGNQPVPSIHLGNSGVKLEAEGHVAGPGDLLETVEEVVEAPWGDMPGPDLSQAYVVDLTQQFNRIFVQTTFNSFKEFEQLFNKFKAETGSVFRIKSSCSISYENSRRKRHFIPSRFKFVTVRYCCVHYGQPKVAGQGIRTKQRYLPCGCESMLSLSYNRGALVISQANMRHNHEVSSEMAPFYAINRRISNAELREVAGAIEMIPNSRSLQNFLQIHFQRPTTIQDAKNVRNRLKALKGIPVAKPRADEEQRLSPHQEEEVEEEEEEIMMECIEEEAVDHFVKEEMEERFGGGNYNGWSNARQEEEGSEQQPGLDPAIRSEVIDRIQTRLSSTLENCDALAFMERVSVIESLIEGWENANTNHTQHTEESISNNRMGRLENMKLSQLRSGGNQTNSQANIENLDVKERTVFHPRQTNGKSAHLNHRRQPALVSEMNRKSDITEFTPSHGNSVQHSRTDKSESNERRPVILSIARGMVDGYEQAVEVEIEVDGEVAKVRTVKREPLDCHEVYVGD